MQFVRLMLALRSHFVKHPFGNADILSCSAQVDQNLCHLGSMSLLGILLVLPGMVHFFLRFRRRRPFPFDLQQGAFFRCFASVFGFL